MEFIPFIFLFLIGGVWLIFRRKMGSKLNTAVSLFVIIGVIFSIIASTPTIIEMVEKNPQYFKNQTISTIFLFSIVSIVMMAYIIGGFWMATTILHLGSQLFKKQEISFDESKSKIQAGGYLIFHGDINMVVNEGYVTAQIISEYGEINEVRRFYDVEQKKGKLQWITKRKFDLKLSIPKEFDHGDYKIQIMLNEVFNLFWIWKTPMMKKIFDTSITIIPEKNPSLEIQKIMKPITNDLDGGICIKTYNNSDNTFEDCFGVIETPDGIFRLYDYQELLKSDKRNGLDRYSVFTIKANSSKLLYAKTNMTDKPLTVSIDIGKKEIKREFFNTSQKD